MRIQSRVRGIIPLWTRTWALPKYRKAVLEQANPVGVEDLRVLSHSESCHHVRQSQADAGSKCHQCVHSFKAPFSSLGKGAAVRKGLEYVQKALPRHVLSASKS